jgi:hypothetical protein
MGTTHKRYPLHRAAPMGFAPSPGWAQAVTDSATLDADLPLGQSCADRLPSLGFHHGRRLEPRRDLP